MHNGGHIEDSPTTTSHSGDRHKGAGGKLILERFAENTTLHGLPRAIRGQSTTSRCVWALIFTCAVAMFLYHLTQLLERCASYPKKVNIEVVKNDVAFFVGDHLQHATSGRRRRYAEEKFFSPFILKYVSHFNNYDPIEAYIKSNPTSEIQRRFWSKALAASFPRIGLSANMPRSSPTRADVQSEKFIVRCMFGSYMCIDIEQTFDPYYFHCFTIKSSDSATIVEGADNGLSAVFLTGSGS